MLQWKKQDVDKINETQGCSDLKRTVNYEGKNGLKKNAREITQEEKLRHNSEVILQLKKHDTEGPAAMYRWNDLQKPE